MKFLDGPSTGCGGDYRIETHRGMRVEEYHGKVTLSDLRSMLGAMASDPCWSPDHHGLIDFAHAELELSANDVLRMALMLRQDAYRTHGWQVFVVSSSVAYGVVRMLGYWSRSTERFRIFHSRDDADRWLQRHRHETPLGFRKPSVAEKETALRNAI